MVEVCGFPGPKIGTWGTRKFSSWEQRKKPQVLRLRRPQKTRPASLRMTDREDEVFRTWIDGMIIYLPRRFGCQGSPLAPFRPR